MIPETLGNVNYEFLQIINGCRKAFQKKKIIKPEKMESEDQSLKLVGKGSNFNVLLYFWIF